MGQYIVKRLFLVIPTLLIILLANFLIVQMAPGGPVEQQIYQIEQSIKHEGLEGLSVSNHSSSNTSIYVGSRGLSQQMIDDINHQYGFDKSAPERFIQMVVNYLRLDFGTSFFKGEKVTSLVLQKLPVSISLGLWSTLIIYLISIPLGIYKALNHQSILDKSSAIFLAIAHAIPVLVLSVVLLMLFAGGNFWQIFPLQGLVSENFAQLSLLGKLYDYFWHLALPLIASSLSGLAALTYLTKFSFMEQLNKAYVITAKSKGFSDIKILYAHVFKNAILTVVSGLPMMFMGILFTSNLIIEVIFNLDGLGLLGFEAIQQRDYPIIFGSLFIFTLISMLLQLVGDLIYHVIDPRIDFEANA